jgi:hypothetical protein
MNLDVLQNKIGTIDEQLDCLYPVYLLYPEVPRYEIYHDIVYFKPIVEQYCKQISQDELKNGDIVVLRFFNGFHFTIYQEVDQIFHCCKTFKLRISNLNKYRKFIVGCYRWQKS